MHIPAPDLEQWITALRRNPEATVTALPYEDPLDNHRHRPAQWHIGMAANAYFYLRSPQDAQRVAHLIPALHDEFQTLTQGKLTRYIRFNTGNFKKEPYTPQEIQAHFVHHDDDTYAITACDAPSKESSSGFLFDGLLKFTQVTDPAPVFRIGTDQALDYQDITVKQRVKSLNYLSFGFPRSFWQSHREALQSWWHSVLYRLAPDQAYLGLSMALPPTLERWPYQLPSEFELAQQFIGLDVDKPFFMRSNEPKGKFLETGLRTPTFGVYLAGDVLQTLGGLDAVYAALIRIPSIALRQCGAGWWVQLGHTPELHPIEQGVPEPQRQLAIALKAVRASRLWLVCYPPSVAQDNIFTPSSASDWLKRFDPDSEWVKRYSPVPEPLPAPAVERPPTIRAEPSSICTVAGTWYTIHDRMREITMKVGDKFPPQTMGVTGDIIWYWKHA